MEDPHQDRLQLVAEKRKWQTEVENKRRQLEDDKRALQQMKTKALRERWLLEGPDGPEQEDETRTRTLEETICRLEQELSSLETGPVYQTLTTVISGCDAAVEVKGHRDPKLGEANPSGQVIQEVKIHKVPQISKSRKEVGEMKKAMYSVEIKVERDRVTGETRVLSTNTTLPVDLSDLGVKVYEDEQKVVHEMNGEDGIHLLSSSEVDELLHKADETSMMLESVSTVTALPKSEVQDGPEPSLGPMMSNTLDPMQSPSGDPSRRIALGPSSGPSPGPFPTPHVAAEISGLEAKSRGELCKEEPGMAGLGVVGLGMAGLDVAGPDVVEASAENPVTMVFMGYQNVEDEDETKKVLGLQGTVKAELVLIENVDRQVDPPAPSSTRPTSTKPPQEMVVRDEETAGEAERGVVEVKKGKQPCKCCSIM